MGSQSTRTRGDLGSEKSLENLSSKTTGDSCSPRNSATFSWATGSWRARSPASRRSLQEQRRVFYEREAQAFAAELLMPFAEVRRRWFAITRERPVQGEMSLEVRVKRLADEFEVTPAAMRVRLQQMKLIPSA